MSHECRRYIPILGSEFHLDGVRTRAIIPTTRIDREKVLSMRGQEEQEMKYAKEMSVYKIGEWPWWKDINTIPNGGYEANIWVKHAQSESQKFSDVYNPSNHLHLKINGSADAFSAACIKKFIANAKSPKEKEKEWELLFPQAIIESDKDISLHVGGKKVFELNNEYGHNTVRYVANIMNLQREMMGLEFQEPYFTTDKLSPLIFEFPVKKISQRTTLGDVVTFGYFFAGIECESRWFNTTMSNVKNLFSSNTLSEKNLRGIVHPYLRLKLIPNL